jgi:UDP-N-acetylglucosamine--N-acetylmuramyl-(pentapeptide) pyrophosphoryl-undecaprenol N-acetylglucosamine transferase
VKILLTGGGTGGHITPILAVAHELKQLQPDAQLVYVGERHGKFAHILEGNTDIDHTQTIYAGKFRRYYGESWLRRFVDVQTLLLNIRDAVYLVLGLLQSLYLMRKLKPDVVFLKGGFVGVPMGLAAAFWHIPFVTHDSDSLPGLANRLVARWARYHATGMPPEFYQYPKDSMRYTGVLVSEDYQPMTAARQGEYKQQLHFPPDAPLLVLTGGSLGAGTINTGFRTIAEQLLQEYPQVRVVHQVGKGKAGVYSNFDNDRLAVLEFMKPMHVYMSAADVVITRAGATTLAELGILGKAAIVVPNPLLTGGHQLTNAKYLTDEDAVLVIDEGALQTDPTVLYRAIKQLLDNPARRQELGQNLQKLSIPDAAKQLAMLLLETGQTTNKHDPQKTTTTTRI